MMAVLVLTACSPKEIPNELKETPPIAQEEGSAYPMRISHAFGETILEKKPERIATISWGNQDVPLALGVIPVGVSKTNYGVQD